VTGRHHSREAADSYIVRVYRRSDQPGHEVAGLVEPVDRGSATAFAGRDELWAALTSRERPRGGAKARRDAEPGQE
jgi:hypothetical protein